MKRLPPVFFSALFLLATPITVFAQQNASSQPFFEARKQQIEYVGEGREDPEPAGLHEVLIGYFGPSNAADPAGGDIWRAISLAIEEANAEGGYRSLPFRVVPAWSENPWGSGVSELARMAFSGKVWAILGGVDGPSTHLAEQVVAKARLVLINPASTDKTVNLAGVPWMFSALPGDHLAAPVVGEALLDLRERFVICSATDHDSHVFLVELRKFIAARGARPAFEYEFEAGTRGFSELAARVAQSKAGAVVVIAGPADSSRLITALHQNGFSGRLVGGPWVARREFLRTAGTGTEEILFPMLEEDSPALERFAEDYSARFGVAPDYAAAQAYDSTRLLVAAIRKAGLNRALICDAVRKSSPWDGVAGTIAWDAVGQNSRTVRLGMIQHGPLLRLFQESGHQHSLSGK